MLKTLGIFICFAHHSYRNDDEEKFSYGLADPASSRDEQQDDWIDIERYEYDEEENKENKERSLPPRP